MPAWQVIGLMLVLSIEALMFYMIPQVIKLSSFPLFVLYPINGVTIIIVIYYYVVLVLSDPSDPRLKDR